MPGGSTEQRLGESASGHGMARASEEDGLGIYEEQKDRVSVSACVHRFARDRKSVV